MRRRHRTTSRSLALCGVLLLCHGPQCRAQTGARDESAEKQLRGRVALSSGEQVCLAVPIRTDRPINLGQAQLTVTLSPAAKRGGDVVLLLRLPKSPTNLTGSDTFVTLCGTVGPLGESQRGVYTASDFAVHLGSGNVTNLGAPDDSFVDMPRLTDTLQTVRVTLAR